jgi:hypothetical protein
MVNNSETPPTLGNASAQPLMLVFGLITLPQKYEVEKDVVMGFIALQSIISIIANGILLLVILKDPFKQLRTITAILLAFNSAANVINMFVLFLDNVFYWRGEKLSPELIVYFCSFTSCLYVIGNLLHTLNTYGAIVVPVRYAVLAPKIRRVLVECLVLIWVVILLVVVIPPYTLPKDEVPAFIKCILTLVCVLFVLLVLTFGYLYTKIFQCLYARRQRLSLAFHLKRSTVRGRAVNEKNKNIVTTLFVHVLFFMITTIPGSVIYLVYLHCTTCDPIKVQLAALFAIPIAYAPLVFLPLLWLSRLKQYKRAMKKTLAFWRSGSFLRRRSKTLNIQGSLADQENKSRSGNCTKELNDVSMAV